MKNFFVRLFLLFILLGLMGCTTHQSIKNFSSSQVCFDHHCVDVELAKTPDQWARGLQFRESLGSHQGMLFIFSEAGTHSFWMKDTLIPLDMIWFNENRKVIYIASQVLPCRQERCPIYGPEEKSLYVLEIPGGSANQWGLRLGSRCDFHLTSY